MLAKIDALHARLPKCDAVAPASRKGRRFALLLGLMLATTFTRSFAADTAGGQFVIRTWGVEEGLPQSFVTAIVQTRDGYLWLGTYGGLTRFDGVAFTTFGSGTTPGLMSDRILALCEDSTGTLWIATEDAGLTRYANGRFTTYTVRDGLPSNLVRAVLADRDGDIWAATLNGLVRRRGPRFEPVELGANLRSSDILSLGQGQDGRLLIGTNRGVAEWKNGRVVSFYAVPYLVLSVFEDRKRNLWLGSPDGVYVLDRNSASRRIPGTRGEVRAILEDRGGALWVGAGNGLFRLENGRWAKFTERGGLSGNFVRTLIEDSEGDIWAGTNANGLNRLRSRSVTTVASGVGLPVESVVPILEDRAGAMWMGLPALGLVRFSPSTGAADGPVRSDGHYRVYGPRDASAHSVIWSLWEDRDGGLWIGGRGLQRLQNGRFQLLPRVGSSLSEGIVFAIYEDRARRLWIGRSSGLFRIENGAVAAAYRKSNGLVGDDVRFITEDRAGALWVGTASGMSRFQNGTFVNYTTRNGLPHNYVCAIHIDSAGTVWIGTYGGGLARLRDGRFSCFSVMNGLAENVISRILEDSRGNLWLSGNHGIHRVNRRELNDYADGKSKTYHVLSYGIADGMKTAQCNGGGSPAGWKTRDGRLWFPTQQGVAVIDPENVTVNKQPPAVRIEQVLLDRKPSEPTGDVSVRPGVSDLEIHYTGLSFSAPDKVRFRYRLADIETDWVDAGTRRTAYYTHLPPGRFRFQVVAANANGVWNWTGAAVDITVIPSFWQTWWFRALIALAIAATVIYLYRRRVHAMEKATAQRAAYASELITSQEGERQRIAAELHDSLGQTLAIIRNRALMSLQEPQNRTRAIEQMDEIADAASHALDEVREIAFNLRPYQIDQLGLRKSIEIMLAQAAESTEIRFVTQVDDPNGTLSPERRIHVYRIVQEAVNNVLKHSSATEAGVSIVLLRTGMTIRISDNGKGFTPEMEGRPRGFGLNGMAERARMLGGRLSIESAPRRGTVIHVSLPTIAAEHPLAEHPHA